MLPSVTQKSGGSRRRSGNACENLQQNPHWVFQKSANFRQKDCALRPVNGAMVYGETEAHDFSHPNLAVFQDQPILNCANAKDCTFRRIDNWVEGKNSVHSQV